MLKRGAKIIFCLLFFLLGLSLGIIIKKTASPVFGWGNGEIISNY